MKIEKKETDKNDRVRTRTITWSDPALVTKPARTMSGLEYVKALKEGTVPPPPIRCLVDFQMTEVEAGRVVFELMPAEYYYNPFSTVHAGITATLLDSAMACAVHSSLSQGVLFTTIEIKVNLIRPIREETGRLRCEGKVIHVGNRTALAEARVTDTKGKLYAHAVSTCIISETRQ